MINRRKGGELLLKVAEHSLYKDCISVCHGVGRNWIVLLLIEMREIFNRFLLQVPYLTSERVLIYVFMVLCQILF